MEIVESIILGFFYEEFGYLIFECIFTLHTYLKWDKNSYHWKYYSKIFPTVYIIPSNSLGLRRYGFFHPTT
jgi:hypothetical protein